MGLPSDLAGVFTAANSGKVVGIDSSGNATAVTSGSGGGVISVGAVGSYAIASFYDSFGYGPPSGLGSGPGPGTWNVSSASVGSGVSYILLYYRVA